MVSRSGVQFGGCELGFVRYAGRPNCVGAAGQEQVTKPPRTKTLISFYRYQLSRRLPDGKYTFPY